jgi:hypothetical protein
MPGTVLDNGVIVFALEYGPTSAEGLNREIKGIANVVTYLFYSGVSR